MNRFTLVGCLFFSMVSAQAADWRCEPEQWSGDTGVSSGHFLGELSASCMVANASTNGFPTLDQFVLSYATSSPGTLVNRGPVPEIYELLPSAFYDVTSTIKSGSEKITIRSDAHLATDLSSRLVLAMISKDIKGTGDLGMIKKLDIKLVTERATAPDGYLIQITIKTDAKKPWYAPSGYFGNEVKKQMVKQFTTIRDLLMPEVAKSL